MRFILAFLLAAACTAAPPDPPDPPDRVVEPRRSDAPAPRGQSLLRAAMLSGHNRARAALGLPPLRWNVALAEQAQVYADALAASGRFEHSRQPRGDPEQGENLWMGTRGAYSFAEMIGHWVGERRFYRAAPIPESSNNGRFGDVAHYTQVVWRETTEVGCALAPNRTDDYLVCRYLPAGNVFGETAY